MDRELTHIWDQLVASLTNSTQGLFMHASWIFVAVMTIVMTTISVGRILPSRKARKTRRLALAESRRVAAARPVGRHYARNLANPVAGQPLVIVDLGNRTIDLTGDVNRMSTIDLDSLTINLDTDTKAPTSSEW